MNPFIKQVITAAVRWAVGLACGYLAAHAGITLSEDQIGKIVAYLVPAVAMLAWSLWEKFHHEQVIATAQVMPAGSTRQEIETAVKAGEAPSVLTPKDRVPL